MAVGREMASAICSLVSMVFFPLLRWLALHEIFEIREIRLTDTVFRGEIAVFS
jgi:hypothetical protein